MLPREWGTRHKLTLSCSDHWSLDQSVEFYKATFAVDAKLGLTGKVCHETHRNRSLFNPYTTARIVKAVPEYVFIPDEDRNILAYNMA